LNKLGFANLYHTINNIAAKEANGIKFNKLAINIALINKNTPCNMADSLVLAPKFMFAELLTIT
jgi:hypothetical protein